MLPSIASNNQENYTPPLTQTLWQESLLQVVSATPSYAQNELISIAM